MDYSKQSNTDKHHLPASAEVQSYGRLDARLKTIVWSVKTLLGAGRGGFQTRPYRAVTDMIASYQGTGYRPGSDQELTSSTHPSARFCAS